MKYINDLTDLKLHHSIVTIGKFDGSHIGHRLLFETAASFREPGDHTVVFTFASNPANVIADDGRQLIMTYEERHFQTYGGRIDYVVECPFTPEIRNMSPEQFIQDILVDRLDTKVVVTGPDFRFGHNRSGDTAYLQRMGRELGFDVVIVEKVRYKGREVSSTYIKEEIRKGNIEDVNAMLGFPFSMIGTVGHGREVGRQIGFPTINFDVPEDKILPPNGVYATKTKIRGREYISVSNIGRRPTFGDCDTLTVETNIVGFDESVYGERAMVSFYAFLRPEKRFASVQELMEEVQRNRQQAIDFFGTISG